MKNQIIITGGAGYIGSHTVVELINAGYEPIIIDDFRNSTPWIIDQIAEITNIVPIGYSIDCTNTVEVEAIFKKHSNIIGVIHFAAYKAVGESVEKPVMYYENNIGSLCTVLSVMQKYKVKNIVFSSSCTVYGEPENPVVTEETPIQKATSPYGDTKITCEKILNFTCQADNNFKATLLRYFNPIGAHPSGKIGELPQGIPNNLVPFITQTAKGLRNELVVFGDDYNTPDGTNIRDYIHVVDLAKAHVAALKWANEKNGGFCEAINLGTGKGSSVLEIINTFEEVNGLKLNFRIGKKRPGDVEQIYANTEKSKELLKWTCEYTLADALKHSWNWEQKIEKFEN